MSELTIGLFALIFALILLYLRLFFFVKLEELDKNKKNIGRINSLVLYYLILLSFIVGSFLLLLSYNKYSSPLEKVLTDIRNVKNYIGYALLFIGLIFLLYKEKLFDAWEERGFRVPLDKTQYRAHLIIIGISFLLIGLFFSII